MCGIFGFFLKNEKINEEKKKIAIESLELLNHRGPDSIGYWINKDNNFFLGHTRLNIIDISSKSNQPYFENQTALSFNGEIYNYLSLKSILKKDFKFKTNGDTEVLFNFLRKNKVENLIDIDGMFAFAYYDSGELFLCTDIFGEKPIYYLENDLGVFFSSEIEPLKKFLTLEKDFSETKKNIFYMFGFLKEETFYKNLKYCPPASFIKIVKGQILIKRNYWSYQNLLQDRNKKKIISKTDLKEIKNLLIESCETRLNSDRPIALLLSSGIDSTLIASILKKEINFDIKCFHASFKRFSNKDLQIDETSLTSKIAKELDLNLYVENIDFDENFFSHKNLIKIFKQPNDNISALMNYQINKSISKKYKVAISGLGADEIFYGYNGYKFFNKNFNIINSKIISWILKNFNFLKIKKIETLKYYQNFKDLELIFSYLNYSFYPKIRNKLFEDLKYIDEISFLDNFSNIRMSSTLPYQMLSASDHSSMQHSLEIRSPYLNRKLLMKLLEFEHETILGQNYKFLQKHILAEYLPKRLINQKKIGFILNPKIFFRNSKKIENEFDNETFRFDRLKLRELIYEEFFKNESKHNI